MSGKNALRMIFFALVLMVIIGGAYTADCVFAESGEHEVTLDISGVTSEKTLVRRHGAAVVVNNDTHAPRDLTDRNLRQFKSSKPTTARRF